MTVRALRSTAHRVQVLAADLQAEISRLVRAVLAWIFLGERPNVRAMLGLVLVAGGVVLVQRRRISNRQLTPQPYH